MESVRYEVCKMIRMLVQVCSTLDQVPSDRFLYMKLTCEYKPASAGLMG